MIVPAQHSEPDVRQAMTIVGDIADIEDTLGRPVPYRLLFTKTRSLRTRLDQFIEEELAREGIARFEVPLVDRISYKEMFLNGVPAHHKERDRGAGLELARLAAEIEAILAPAPAFQAAGAGADQRSRRPAHPAPRPGGGGGRPARGPRRPQGHRPAPEPGGGRRPPCRGDAAGR